MQNRCSTNWTKTKKNTRINFICVTWYMLFLIGFIKFDWWVWWVQWTAFVLLIVTWLVASTAFDLWFCRLDALRKLELFQSKKTNNSFKAISTHVRVIHFRRLDALVQMLSGITTKIAITPVEQVCIQYHQITSMAPQIMEIGHSVRCCRARVAQKLLNVILCPPAKRIYALSVRFNSTNIPVL